jgi:hypothetical protein
MLLKKYRNGKGNFEIKWSRGKTNILKALLPN